MHAALVGHPPAGWAAWQSLRLRTKDGVEGEGDFVLGVLNRGLLFREVKGGSIPRRGRAMVAERCTDDHAAPADAGYVRNPFHKLRELGA